MRIEPEIGGASIVMLGHFNPQIFQPYWFAKYDLITTEAAAAANVPFVHPEITSFRIEGEFNVQVERGRFSIDRAVAPLIQIADVVSGIFEELLPHTPIGQVGINRSVHFDVGSLEAREAIWHKLAPIEPWGEWGKLLRRGQGPRHGGLATMTMTQRELSDRPAGWINAKVEPSNVVGRAASGIFMEINDHYDLARQPEGAYEIVEIVRSRFDTSIANADSIIDQIMSLKP